MLDVPESLLVERRRLGLDVFDEMWEGVLHMVPPPSGLHQRLAASLFRAIGPAVDGRGLVVLYETGLFAAADDYRVPDIVVVGPSQCSDRGVEGAVLVIELRSPYDETEAKLAWYVERGVDEVLVVDPPSRRIELFVPVLGRPTRAAEEAGWVMLATVGVRLRAVEGPRLQVDDSTEVVEL